MSYPEAKRHLADRTRSDSAFAGGEGWLEYSRSEFFRQPLPPGALADLLGNLGPSGPPRPGDVREVTFTPWGGAYHRVPRDATAFVHRDELFLIEHVVRVPRTAATQQISAARGWLARSWSAVHPWGSGQVYPNFPDPELTGWAGAYITGPAMTGS